MGRIDGNVDELWSLARGRAADCKFQKKFAQLTQSTSRGWLPPQQNATSAGRNCTSAIPRGRLEISKNISVNERRDDINIVLDMAESLKELFVFHAEPGGIRLDLQRFLEAQAMLASLAGHTPDKMKAMSDFLSLSDKKHNNSEQSMCDVYCEWQVKELKDQELNDVQISKLLKDAVQYKVATRSTKACHKAKKEVLGKQEDTDEQAERMIEAFRKKAQHKEDQKAILRKLSLDQLSSQDVQARQMLRAKQLAAIGAEVVAPSQWSQTTVAEAWRKEEDELIKGNHDNQKSEQPEQVVSSKKNDIGKDRKPTVLQEKMAPLVSSEKNDIGKDRKPTELHEKVSKKKQDVGQDRKPTELQEVSSKKKNIGKDRKPTEPQEEVCRQLPETQRYQSRQNLRKEKEIPSTDEESKKNSNAAVVSFGTTLQTQSVLQALVKRAAGCLYSCHSSAASVADSLIEGVEAEDQKAWILYAWICHHIKYDADGLSGKAPRMPTDTASVLKNRICVCAGYANLFQSLCQQAGLDCREIVGYARTSENKIGEKLKDDDLHAWNAVKLSGDWMLVDCTWGAGYTTDGKFKQHFRPHYFGVAPAVLTYSHYPRDVTWQLRAKPLSFDAFLAQPHIGTATFFGLGLDFPASTGPAGVIMLKNSNQGKVDLKVPTNVELLVSLDGDRAGCFQQRHGNYVSIHFRAPKGAKQHKLKIFARMQDSGQQTYDECCEFTIVGAVGPAGFVEPCFPIVWEEAFTKHGLQFDTQAAQDGMPSGLLKPDNRGNVCLRLRVPEGKKITAHVKGANHVSKPCTCSREASDIHAQVVYKISCDVGDMKGDLTIFAGDSNASSLTSVVQYRVGG
jgi:hypothetical protein